MVKLEALLCASVIRAALLTKNSVSLEPEAHARITVRMARIFEDYLSEDGENNEA